MKLLARCPTPSRERLQHLRAHSPGGAHMCLEGASLVKFVFTVTEDAPFPRLLLLAKSALSYEQQLQSFAARYACQPLF